MNIRKNENFIKKFLKELFNIKKKMQKIRNFFKKLFTRKKKRDNIIVAISKVIKSRDENISKSTFVGVVNEMSKSKGLEKERDKILEFTKGL